MTREEALMWLRDITYSAFDRTTAKERQAVQMAIEALQDRPKGEWIEKYNGNGWNDFWDYACSHCGKKYERADAVLYHANFCPNCGARMESKKEYLDKTFPDHDGGEWIDITEGLTGGGSDK